MNERDELQGFVTQLLTAIKLCMEQGLQQAALILMYSTMDIAGSLASDNPKAHVSVRFTRWVAQYVTTTGSNLQCTPDDLYGARCGLLHAFTPDSDRSKHGRARRILIAWGSGPIALLHALIDAKSGRAQTEVAVHANELFEQLAVGLARFICDVDADPDLAKGVYEKVRKFYVNVPMEPMDEGHDPGS